MTQIMREIVTFLPKENKKINPGRVGGGWIAVVLFTCPDNIQRLLLADGN